MDGKFVVLTKMPIRWISEKVDGVRAFWDGKTLWTRQGSEIKAPHEFMSELPHGITLDGELWAGRGTFEQLAFTLNSEQDWQNIRYFVFDLPSVEKPQKERMEILRKVNFPSQV